MTPASLLVALGVVSVLCAALPWAVACLMVPGLEASDAARVKNWRGKEVVLGLGAVWTVWGGCALIAGWFLEDAGVPLIVHGALSTAGVLAVGASAFGLIDDTYGTREFRGFAGHLSALLHGRLTTGGLKLLGIGIASLLSARAVSGFSPWGGTPLGVLVAGAAIALAANLENLLDLRPGRALKAYFALAFAGALLLASSAARLAGGGFTSSAALLLVALIGPAVACWRYDLGERAMLGDAGANAMGAVAGLAIVSGLTFVGVWLFAGALLALNLLSERVSFSAIIERFGSLAWLDRLGRARVANDGASGPHEGSGSRYDGSDTGGGSREV